MATLPHFHAFSAPGKALLAGGYLVLDPQYKAYATALSTRMHSVISGTPIKNGETSTITVSSPQFLDGDWSYEFSTPFSQLSDTSSSKNPFLLATIDTILTYVNPVIPYNLKITIFSDPAYHSQDDTSEKISNNGSNSFLYHKEPINKVAKTGLGSSAGLVTVLSAALLSYYQQELDLSSELGLQTIHNLAQISHCIAQGKVGSGFDVGAAVYGSIIYRRFDPSIIADLTNYKLSSNSFKDYQKKLQSIVNEKWDMIIQKCDLPPKIRILMGDIKSGSETPKLIGKVMDWKKKSPVEFEKLFNDLNFCNMQLVSQLLNLTKISIENPKVYNDLISVMDDYSLIQLKHLIKMEKNASSNFMKSIEPLLGIIESISAIRANLQLLTKNTKAEIEPMEQTILLDNCFTLPGVFGGVVPGAGGYDAICLLCSENAIPKILKLTNCENNNDLIEVKKDLDKLATHKQSEFENIDIDSIDLKLFHNVTWLDLHEENKGLISHLPDNYIGLL